MLAYIVRRILLMIPTVFGIMLVSFVIVQFAPGGPVERVIAQLQGFESGGSRLGGGAGPMSEPRRRRKPGSAARPRNTGAPRASTPSSSRNSNSSSASTNPPTSASP